MRNRKTLPAIALIAAGAGDPELLSVRGASLLASARGRRVRPGGHGPGRRAMTSRSWTSRPRRSTPPPSPRLSSSRHAPDAGRCGLYAGDPFLDGRASAEAKVIHRAKAPFEILPSAADVDGCGRLRRHRPGGTQVQATAGRRPAVGEVDAETLADASATVVVRNGGRFGRWDREGRTGRRAYSGVDRDGRRQGWHHRRAADDRDHAGRGRCRPEGRETDRQRRRVHRRGGRHRPAIWAGSRAKPLFGWRVLVPRTKEQAGELSAQLRCYGAVPGRGADDLGRAAAHPAADGAGRSRASVAGRYQWIAFTAVNAVRAIREKFEEYGLDARPSPGSRSPRSASRPPRRCASSACAPTWCRRPTSSRRPGCSRTGRTRDDELDPIDRVFLPRADIATENLVAGLIELGWEVDDVTAYRTVRAAPPPARDPRGDQDRRVRRGRLHLVEHGAQPRRHRRQAARRRR